MSNHEHHQETVQPSPANPSSGSAKDSAFWPRLLGYAGLIPPAFFVLVIVLFPGELAAKNRAIMIDYAALVFSFLGGINWGLALRMPDTKDRRDEYLLGVTPMLIAFVILTSKSALMVWSLPLFLLALLYRHSKTAAREKLPPWFMRLRFDLTMGLSVFYLLSVAL